jgi:predicted DCC family thiol-disulfide oxidoreductase YuxK
MFNLFVLFDPNCGFCRRCKQWLQIQRQIIPLTFIEAASSEAKQLFPVLNHEETLTELTVISDNGAVYHGTKAWLIVLWSLKDYRGWARTLATPEMMPVAQKFITMVSDNRKTISKMVC